MADPTYRIVPIDGGFVVEHGEPSFPIQTQVGFATEAAADAWIAVQKSRHEALKRAEARMPRNWRDD